MERHTKTKAWIEDIILENTAEAIKNTAENNEKLERLNKLNDIQKIKQIRNNLQKKLEAAGVSIFVFLLYTSESLNFVLILFKIVK